METMIQMKKNIIVSIMMAVITTAVLLGAAPLKIYAGESVVIRSLNLKFDSQFGDQEILMPQVSTTTAGVSVQDLVWKRDISKWKAAKAERVSIILNSSNTIFAETYNRSECKITGARFVSAKALDNNTLEVKVDYIPVVKLGNTARAGWADSNKTKAVWDKVEFATGYKVSLYADDKLKKALTVETNTVDLSDLMDKNAVYYYEVRAIGFTAEDRKYLKEGDNITSQDITMEYEGSTSGTWKGSSYVEEDGGTPRNSWKQILNDWYYFDANGVRRTGWVQTGIRWYYLNPADGKLLTGWQSVNGKWYYLNPTGGEMLTGWIQPQPGIWYYMNSDGSMASSTNIGGYQIGADGKWIQ